MSDVSVVPNVSTFTSDVRMPAQFGPMPPSSPCKLTAINASIASINGSTASINSSAASIIRGRQRPVRHNPDLLAHALHVPLPLSLRVILRRLRSQPPLLLLPLLCPRPLTPPRGRRSLPLHGPHLTLTVTPRRDQSRDQRDLSLRVRADPRT
eukprot:1218051-Rhodomonas_salina.2